MSTVLSQVVYESQQVLLIQVSYLFYIMKALANNLKIQTMGESSAWFQNETFVRSLSPSLFYSIILTFYIFYVQLSSFFGRCF